MIIKEKIDDSILLEMNLYLKFTENKHIIVIAGNIQIYFKTDFTGIPILFI